MNKTEFRRFMVKEALVRRMKKSVLGYAFEEWNKQVDFIALTIKPKRLAELRREYDLY